MSILKNPHSSAREGDTSGLYKRTRNQIINEKIKNRYDSKKMTKLPEIRLSKNETHLHDPASKTFISVAKLNNP